MGRQQRFLQKSLSKTQLKRVIGACLIITSSKRGLGLTAEEVAGKSGVPLPHLQKSLWRVRKRSGVQLVRSEANTTALLARICDRVGLFQQRSAVCHVAMRLVVLAYAHWICTGRRWIFIVMACFTLAARSYHIDVNIYELG